MKKLGIIDTFGFSSGLNLLHLITKEAKQQFGGTEAGQIMVCSLHRPSANIEEAWNSISGFVISKAYDLKNAKGCDFVALSSNLLSQINLSQELALQEFLYEEDSIKKDWKAPALIDINDSIINSVIESGARRILLLGPSYVMRSKLLRAKLAKVGIEMMDVTNYWDETDQIDQIINDLVTIDKLDDESVEFLVNFINEFPCDSDERPDAIVLGCQELSEIITEDFIFDGVPLIDGSQAYVKDLVKLIA